MDRNMQKDEEMSRDSAVIRFEVGDRVHCPYYGCTGIIQSIKPDPNTPDNHSRNIIDVLKDGGDDYHVYTKVCTKSANSPLPCYLQMVSAKRDFKLQEPRRTGGAGEDKFVRAVNLSTGVELSFMPDTDPAYAVCYGCAEEADALDEMFVLVHNGFTDWISMVDEGIYTYSKGDWCAFKPDRDNG
jgi:hypothetical protein